MLVHEMKFGRWERAIFKSVVWGFMLLIACLALAQFSNGGFASVHENVFLIVMTGFVYFGLSIIGWLIVGIPVHFIIC